MDFYRNLLYIFLCIIPFNLKNLVDSTPTNHKNSNNNSWSVQTKQTNEVTGYQTFSSNNPKPLKPPDSTNQNLSSYKPNRNINLIKINFDNKQTNDKIIYEYNSKTNTHSFIANTGYLFNGAEEGAKTLWTCSPGKYADKINITEHSDDKRSIMIYIPVDGESEESEIEIEDRLEKKIPKIYKPNKKYKEVYMYDTEDEYKNKIQKEKSLNKQKSKNIFDFEIKDSKNKKDKPPLLLTNKTEQNKNEPYKPLFITLDIKNKHNTIEYNYEYNKHKDIDIFTPTPGFIIDEVIKGKHQMWHYEHGEYPEKVFIYKNEYGEKMLRLKFPKSEIKQTTHTQLKHSDSEYEISNYQTQKKIQKTQRHYDPLPRAVIREYDTNKDKTYIKSESLTITPRLEDIQTSKLHKTQYQNKFEIDQLKSIDKSYDTHTEVPQYKIPVELNIDFRWNTFLFDYSKLNNVSTYTAKEGYAFRKVKLFKGYYSRESDLILWETDNPEKFANKVIVIGHNKIILYLDDGTTAVFKKGYNNLWIKDKYTSDCSSLAWDYQYIKLDINNKRPTDVYSVSKYYHDPNIWEYIYIPRNGFKFSMVKQANEVIWVTTDENKYSVKVGVIKFSKLMTQVLIGLVDETTLIYVKRTSGSFNKIKFVDY